MKKKSPSQTKRHAQEIKAFAAFNDRGQILYATIKPTRSETESLLTRFNPPVEGHHYPFQVHPVYIGLDAGFQYDLESTLHNQQST
jgi:hypothetical protein